MGLALIAVVVAAALFIAWLAEFGRPEKPVGPEREQFRRALRPTIILAVATALVLFIITWVLRSSGEGQLRVAWTAVRAPSATAPLQVGGGEDGAVIGWPGGHFWPALHIEPIDETRCRVTTRGSYGFVRSGPMYFNGIEVAAGGGSRQVGPFWLELDDERILVREQAAAMPLLSVPLPEPSDRWVRSLGQLMAIDLFDLRSRGAVSLERLHALDEWASHVRIVVLDETKMQVLAPELPAPAPAELALGVDGAPLEIVWPGQRLVTRVALRRGAISMTFEAPWAVASPLPPFVNGTSTLTFSRVPRPNANIFVLPTGEGARNFSQEIELREEAGGAVFTNGTALDAAGDSEDARPHWFDRLRPSRSGTVAGSSAIVSSYDLALGHAIVTASIARVGPIPFGVETALWLGWLLLIVGFCTLWVGDVTLTRSRELWSMACLLLSLWPILAVRVLLSVRYVMDSRAVDSVTVKGLASSLAALVIVPLFALLAVLMWSQQSAIENGWRRRPWQIVVAAAVLLGGSIVEYVLMPPQILPALPERLRTSVLDDLLLVVVLVAAVALLAASQPPARLRAVTDAARRLWLLPYHVVSEIAPRFWRTVTDASASPASKPHRAIIDVAKALSVSPLARVFVIWISIGVAIFLVAFVLRDFMRQVIGPLWIIGLPALLIAAAPVALQSGSGATDTVPRTTVLTLVVIAVAFLPAFVSLLMFDDIGAIYAVIAFHLPLALLLLLTHMNRLGRAFIMAIVAGVALAYAALVFAYSLAPGMTEHILSRVEVTKYGQAAQDWLLDLEAPASGDATAVTATSVRNALVHEWEHMAITRKGGVRGLGFGRAPAEQSFIRLDTIQYDSVFSFFIVGEHGMIGGIALLLVYTAPMVVLSLRRKRLRVGDVIAVLIGASFAGESFAHAAMNTSQLWFTGRNLPLMATASFSDLLRWAILLALAAQASLWSARDERSTRSVDVAFMTERPIYDDTFARPRRRAVRMALFGAAIVTPIALWAITQAGGWLLVAASIPLAAWLTRRRFSSIVALPAAVVGALLLYGWYRAAASPEYDAFTWSRLLGVVDSHYENGRISYDPRTHRIRFRTAHGWTARPSGKTLLEAEILRFNTLPERERMGGDRTSLDPTLFSAIASPRRYEQAVRELWHRDSARPIQRRPPLFAIEQLPLDSGGAAMYRVTGNRRYNVVHTFHDPLTRLDVGTVGIQNAADQRLALVGPAWVMGRWTHTVSDDTSRLGLGWMTQLADALDHLPAPRRLAIRSLTLDAELQTAVQTVADLSGTTLHDRLLADRADLPLPPRVAVTVMRATTGEVLALGSWPRASASPVWSTRSVSAVGGGVRIEPVPSVNWLRRAPAALGARYGANHNFSAIEMGSATKPFWATAALVVNPRLRELSTWNEGCDRIVRQRCHEEFLFGRRIRPGWQVFNNGQWVDFDRYLAASDNRYHTRLGLLAFAEPAQNGVVASDGGRPSGSRRESFNGGASAWNRFPRFPAGMLISRNRQAEIARLHEQPVAIAIRDLFGVSTGAREVGGPRRYRRISFWSGDERDDIRTVSTANPLEAVSPDGTNLSLQRINSTRSLIAILLGGASNRWSNVQAAAAFSSWALGRPVVPRIIAGPATALGARTQAFTSGGADAARLLRPGLRAVLDSGTAAALQPVIERYRRQGYEVFAKTGTLASTDPDRPTSRILLTIVPAGANPTGGITISFMAERATGGYAVDAVRSLLITHQELFDRALRP